jgi:hypothetical protein
MKKYLIPLILLVMAPVAFALYPIDKQVDRLGNTIGGPLMYIPAVGTQFLSDTNAVTVTGKNMSGLTNTFTNIPSTALPTFNGTQAGIVPPDSTIQGYFLRDDGTWVHVTGGGGGSPGGSSTAVQINEFSAFGGNAAYIGTSTDFKRLLLGGATDDSTSWLQANGNIAVSGTTITSTLKVTTSPTSGYVLTSDSSGNATWQAPSGGGSSRTTNTVSSMFTIPTLTKDYLLNVDTSLGAIPITLPDATASSGWCVDIKNIGSPTNNLTVGTQMSQTIDAAATATINGTMDSRHLCANGGNWFNY